MYKDLSVITKNYSLPPKRFYDLKRRYLGLYKAKLLEAYDLGYTQEAEVFSKSDFLKAYSQEGIHLEFQDGEIQLKSWVFYLEWLMSNKENEFYFLMVELLTYREACTSIDTAYDGIKMYKAKTSKSLTWGIYYSTMGMVGSSRMVQLNEVTYELLLTPEQCLSKEQLTHPIIYGLAEKWGVTVHQVLATHLFDDVTISDIAVCLEEVLSSELVFDNPKIKSVFGNYLTRYNSLSEIYDLGQEDFLNELNEVMTNVSSKGESILGANDVFVFSSKLKDDSYSEQVPFGAFSVDYDTSEVLPLVNNFYGVTGDFIRLDSSSIIEGDYNYLGCPIMLVDSSGSNALYLDVEQVVGLGESSLISDLGLTMTFSERGSHKLLPEDDLTNFYVNGFFLQDEGVFIRTLKGSYSQDEKDSAIKKAIKLLGLK